MAQTVIITDDLDGSPDADTYKILDPLTGKTYSIDLAKKSLDMLTKALAPFIAAGRPATAEPIVRASKGTGSGRQTRDYDKTAFRIWAEQNDKWTGKRPSHALIDEFEASTHRG